MTYEKNLERLDAKLKQTEPFITMKKKNNNKYKIKDEY
jgi:hypothetical protein